MCIRVAPTGLADGLGLGVSYGHETDAPLGAWFPRVLRVAQHLGRNHHTPANAETQSWRAARFSYNGARHSAPRRHPQSLLGRPREDR
jgi:hypothetical protein